MKSMRLSQRLIAMTVLAAISTALAGCSGGFDPTDMMDWFDTKKKIPGERKPVFPDGVPGVEQGVPKDLYKGAQQQPQDQPPPVAETAPPPPAPEPKARHRSSSRSAARAAPAAEPAQDAAPAESEEGAAAAVPPAPPPPKVKRKRITAP